MKNKLKGLLSLVLCAVMLFSMLPGTMVFAADNSAAGDVPMFRLYNPNSSEHFYTGSVDERDGLVALGWVYEGVSWNAPVVGEPVYRVYNPNSGDHHYTMDWKEIEMLVNAGWQYEGVAWNSADQGGLPIYRVWNPNADLGSHHFTGTADERTNLIVNGWIDEGIGWYGVVHVAVTLTANCSELTVGEDGTVYFYAQVTSDAESIKLMDAATNTVVTELKDDGMYSSSGDDLPNDNIYSGKVDVSTTAEAQHSYYAVATVVGSDYSSAAVKVNVIAGFSNDQLDQMETVDQAIQNNIFAADGFEEMADADKKAVAENALNDLDDQGLIDSDTMHYDEESGTYSFMYSSGALGAVILKDWKEDQNGMEIETVETEAAPAEEAVEETAEAEVPEEQAEVTEPEATEEDIVEVTSEEQDELQKIISERYANAGIPEGAVAYSASNDTDAQPLYVGEALVLWSFDQAWDDSSYRVPFYNDLEASFEALGLDTTVDWYATVEDYKKLEGYEVIMFSGHGANTEFSYRDASGKKVTQTHSSLLLREDSTQDKDDLYASDLKQFRIGKLSVNGGVKYAILPDFFNYYYDSGDLDGTFVFAENCEFRGKNDKVANAMGNALLNASAEAVIGFHNSVMADYSRELMQTYITGLIEGKTAGDAFAAAKKEHGDDDYFLGREWLYGPTAYPIFSGDSSAILLKNDIINGDFEEASTAKGWSQVGDTRILGQLGTLTPSSKLRMAILTTGIGSAEEDYLSGTEGSVLSQVFRIPENKTKLTFSYNVVSEEPTEFVGSSFNDTFLALLTTSDDTHEMAMEDINTSTWYEVTGIDFDGGDDTTYQTTWKTVTYDVSAYAGQNVNLQFVVYDVGDSIYDTAALIDNVYLS